MNCLKSPLGGRYTQPMITSLVVLISFLSILMNRLSICLEVLVRFSNVVKFSVSEI